MKTIRFKPEFETKLKKLRIKTLFVKRLREDGPLNKRRVSSLNGMISFCSFIMGSFIWNDTKEGYKFWDKIANS